MMKKISLIFLISIILASAVVLPSNAALAQPPVAQPLWDNISTITSNVIFDGNTGYASGAATKKSGCSSMDGTLIVYKIISEDNWEYIDSVYKYSFRGSIAMEIEFQGESGCSYVSKFIVTAYRDGVGETFTKYIYKDCP